MPPISKELVLSDGGKIVLYDPDSPVDRTQKQYNIERINRDGSRRWLIGDYAPFQSSKFTNIYFDDSGQLQAYNFDGGEYTIDIETGRIIASRLIR